VLSRFVERDRWRQQASETVYHLHQDPGQEPDWFGVSYRIPVDPNAPLEVQMQQFREHILPRFNEADRKGEWLRMGGGQPDG